ncbi:MAG: hypothetical protein H0X64_06075 [Gemmatimonadaceae bacterium]|nr:hypothetical protein [Gemmatimonadaceae bacterium]
MQPASPEERLARLERLVERMSGDMFALRQEVAQVRAGAAPGPAMGRQQATAPTGAPAREQATAPTGAPAREQAAAPRTGPEPIPAAAPTTAFGRGQALRDFKAAGARGGNASAASVEDATSDDRRDGEAGRRGPDFSIHSHWTADGVEKAAGRYGMLALATITGLAAVGTFISWAAARVEIGPEAQVGIGVLVALALAVAGIRLLPRERSFGGVLLGLALAVTHVCAWGAGPAVLDLVPAGVALSLALVASAALGVFAHREDDEPLWCAGFGGAAIAPFVTTDGRGSAVLLALYGGLVMLAGCWALRGREWSIAGRVLAVVGALYTGGLLAAGERENGPALAMGLAMGVATLGVLPFAGEGMRRSRLRAFGILAAIAALAALDIRDPQLVPGSETMIIVVIGASVLLWLWLVDRTAELPAGTLLDGIAGEGSTAWDWVDAAFIPLAFLAALLGIRVGAGWNDAVPAAAIAGASALLAWRRAEGPLRDAAVFTVCAGALLATWSAGELAGEWQLALMSVPAVAFVAANRSLRASTWLPMAALTLIPATSGALSTLGERADFAYTPFLTMPSFTAMAFVAAWVAASLLCAERAKAFRIAAWIAAFVLVHQELSGAISPTVSTLLIISYYAVTAVALVGAGRHFANASLRHVGLVMALVAAAAAGRGAARLDAVWAQIAGYLVTSAFLLGLAWWYRRRGDEPTDTAPQTTVGGMGT